MKAHLDPSTDAASRSPETILKTVDWISATLGLKIQDNILDLGCGPGLYAVLFAQQGLNVTGVDFSQNSIDYAIRKAREVGLQITFRCEDYLPLKDEAQYDTALLIYGDFCILSPSNRTKLLVNIHRALKSGGYLVLDVSTPVHRQRVGANEHWYADHAGFWREGHPWFWSGAFHMKMTSTSTNLSSLMRAGMPAFITTGSRITHRQGSEQSWKPAHFR